MTELCVAYPAHVLPDVVHKLDAPLPVQRLNALDILEQAPAVPISCCQWLPLLLRLLPRAVTAQAERYSRVRRWVLARRFLV